MKCFVFIIGIIMANGLLAQSNLDFKDFKDFKAFLLKGGQCLNESRFDKQTQHKFLQRMVQEDPTNCSIRFTLGMSYYSLSKLDSALIVF